ncbi:Formamidopyrimidine-DNA glycosylase [Methanimicrococcus sp. At1]|uniref:Formamidopyrimidine-DNA glycosylase n=1 Tax=Methanimicrococcus hacksteinii TaxID=3028293 RepID=A0ABU3VPC5_9EURY|nr:hypothetical protein [Methanimicrococcus sp. At1]MDV0445253.1 Formamidopyrimidine-DNA glycosylase [Methanimicrococcus sp. At1]
MNELPECIVIAGQMSHELTGKTVSSVIAGKSPHKFAFFYGDPNNYEALLRGKTIQKITPIAGYVELSFGNEILLFGEGVNIRCLKEEDSIPEKHQLLIEFDDKTALVCTVQMYGGMWVYKKGENDNPYYTAAVEKPSSLSGAFSEEYFNELIIGSKQTLNLKAFLATEQRIPGLGNGVLQDILFNAKLHPKRKLNSLSEDEKKELYKSIKKTLKKMANDGGRDTEKDIYGKSGGYSTILSNKTAGKPCKICGETILKETMMGGTVYICPGCQKL